MILVIEASAEPASLCLHSKDCTKSLSFPNGNKVNEVLFTELDRLLEDSPTISQVLVGLGPGSYSGARVGLAAAQAIALYHHCPLAGLNSLNGVSELKEIEQSVIIGDARRNGYYLVSLNFGKVEAVSEIFTHEEFQEKVTALDSSISLHSFEKPERFKLTRPIKQITPSAEGLLHHWNDLNQNEQSEINQTPPVVNYMRPAFITKPKKSA